MLRAARHLLGTGKCLIVAGKEIFEARPPADDNLPERMNCRKCRLPEMVNWKEGERPAVGLRCLTGKTGNLTLLPAEKQEPMGSEVMLHAAGLLLGTGKCPLFAGREIFKAFPPPADDNLLERVNRREFKLSEMMNWREGERQTGVLSLLPGEEEDPMGSEITLHAGEEEDPMGSEITLHAARLLLGTGKCPLFAGREIFESFPPPADDNLLERVNCREFKLSEMINWREGESQKGVPSSLPGEKEKMMGSGNMLHDMGYNPIVTLAKKGLCGDDKLPERVDWREKGAIGPVRDQLHCRCCWAIAPVESVEALHQITTGEFLQLSVQQVVDCNRANRGCYSGNALKALDYIAEIGLTTEALYPFVPHKFNRFKPIPDLLKRIKQCKMNRRRMVFIDGYTIIHEDELSLKKAVAIQPVVARVHVNKFFQEYTGNIIRIKDCPPPTDEEVEAKDEHGNLTYVGHSILVIGYDSDEEGKFWLCMNSYGKNWGKHGGFFKLEREVAGGDPAGVCGLYLWKKFYPVGHFIAPLNPITNELQYLQSA